MPKHVAMKILQVCKKYPYPLKDGESIAIHNLSRSLTDAGAQVSLLAMNTLRHPYRGPTPSAFEHYEEVHTVPVDNRIRAWPALQNLFSSSSYHIDRFISPAFAKKLQSLLAQKDYDVIQLETIYLAPYLDTIRQHSHATVAMRAHNVEHEIWQRMVAHCGLGPKRWYLRHLTRKLARFEREMLQEYDLLVAITRRDLAAFQQMGYRNPGVVTPIGLLLSDYDRPEPTRPNGHLSVSFIGSLDWMPNIEGLRWFLDTTWPLISSRWPNMRLHIAGRNTPDWLRDRTAGGVIVHGEVPDAAEFIQKHPLMVVPLRSGSGMRAKILEGMAMGKAVLTTTLGLEGIDAEPGREVLVADQPEEFVSRIADIQENPLLLEDMGDRARQLVAAAYDRNQLGQQLLLTYQELRMKVLP